MGRGEREAEREASRLSGYRKTASRAGERRMPKEESRRGDGATRLWRGTEGRLSSFDLGLEQRQGRAGGQLGSG